MTYQISFWSGEDDTVETVQSADTAAEALEIAVRGGGNATISTREDTYSLTEFRDALEAGEFDA